MVDVNLLGATLTGHTGCGGIAIACLWEVAARFVLRAALYFYPGFGSTCEIVS